MRQSADVQNKSSLMSSMVLHPRSAVRQAVKEIDTGEVLSDDQIDEKVLEQAQALSADERHILSDPKLFSKHITKLEKEMLKGVEGFTIRASGAYS